MFRDVILGLFSSVVEWYWTRLQILHIGIYCICAHLLDFCLVPSIHAVDLLLF